MKVACLIFLRAVCVNEGHGSYWEQNHREESWSWGRDDYLQEHESKPQRNHPSIPTTTTTALPPPKNESDPCEPYEPKMPDFREAGRLVSQVKCYEYIWAIKTREAKKGRGEQCRRKKGIPSIVPIIVGGHATTPGEYPHMGAIGWKARVGTWLFMCGGSLVSDKFVLTAAHCTSASPTLDTVDDVKPKVVRLGDKNILDMPQRGYPPIDANILRIIVHPDFHSPKKYNDIALLQLDAPLKEFSSFLQPACLWGQDDTTSLGNQASVTGWGVVETASRTVSPELQSAAVDILDPDLCSQLTLRWCNRNWCGLKNQICGGKLAGGVDSCQGDSGGPLQVKINLPPSVKTKMYYVIGVTSFGIGCGRTNTPGIYTQISKYIGWIESIVWP